MDKMMPKLFALLRSAICKCEFDKSFSEDIDENNLEDIFDISKKHDLVHLVATGLDNAGLLSNNEISEIFAEQQFIAVYRYENLKHEFDRVCGVLDEEKIPYIPLKGAVIRDLYPEPWMRTSCDIDILVREDFHKKAVKIIEDKLDYRAEKNMNYHDVSLFSEGGIHLELHFNIKENISKLDEVLEMAWNFAECDEGVRYSFNKEFLVFYHVAHTAYHFIHGGCGIRPFIDLFLLTKSGYNTEKVAELCRKGGIESFFNTALNLTDVWFGYGEHNELTERMETHIVQGGVYGTQKADITFKQSTKGGKVGYIRSRVFVSYDSLKQRYPMLKNRAATPVYQVRRWIDTIRGKRVSHIFKELKISASIDSQAIDAADLLVKDLGLSELIK